MWCRDFDVDIYIFRCIVEICSWRMDLAAEIAQESRLHLQVISEDVHTNLPPPETPR